MEITTDMINTVLSAVSASNEEVKAALEQHQGNVEQAISFLVAQGFVKQSVGTEGSTDDLVGAASNLVGDFFKK